MALQWRAADLRNGDVIADLPGFDPAWPIRRTVSTTEAAAGVLHLSDKTTPNWERAILDGGAQLVAYDDTDPAQPIVWGGIVWSAGPFDSASDDVPVSLSTWESALDNAIVGDATYTTAWHRDDIIADLITSWFTPNTGITLGLEYTPGGGPAPVEMDNPPTPGDALIFQNTDNATVKSRIDQVIAQLGGEYTVELVWSDDQTAVVPLLRFGDRLGVSPPAGQGPNVTFEVPGTVTSLQQMRDYSPGSGATKVVAYSTGQGDSQPFADPVFAADDVRPVWEFRYQPVTNISTAGLLQYARQAIAILGPGHRPVTLTASLARTTGRKLGTDWQLGDDVGYRCPPGLARAFPNGLDGVGRCLGYELTDTTISPVLADTTVYVQGG